MNPIALTLVLTLALPLAGHARYLVASHVSVAGERVTLADLVPDAPAGWQQVALGRSPRPGDERVLAREWVLQRAQQVGAEDVLELGGDVVVSRPGGVVDREAVIAAVEQALLPRLHPGENLRIDAVGLPNPVAAEEFDLVARLPDGELPSPATLWVDVEAGGKRVGRAWVRLEIARGRPVLVLTRHVRRGDVIAAEDVEVRSGQGGSGGYADPSQVVGKQLVRSLRAGSAPGPRDLEAVPLVDRGDLVRVVARVGGVLASTMGKSLETGGVGDLVRVENLQSGRQLIGVLQEGGVVEIAGYGR
ncbi:MAG: flagellar basal body P-ring formation chaperone FlgA [Deferrisomatales bacterium]|nr:flagellar basal body P-ring formation chaperone FlgA [Deferrisomatales bacterium]